MEELAVTSIEVDITESVRIQFRDIEQDENIHDVTYENVQARTRTEILMNKANQVGGLDWNWRFIRSCFRLVNIQWRSYVNVCSKCLCS